MDFSIFSEPQTYVSLLTLSLMEIVLGIDNVIFISIVVERLPTERQAVARRIGLSLALFMRLGLVAAISWIMGLGATLFTVLGEEISGRDLILLVGGLFLIAKSTHEIYDKLESADGEADGGPGRQTASFGFTLAQILVLDIVFSLDSVITAVGMAKHLTVMVIAMVVAVGVMLLFAKAIGDFVNRHPSMKILALSFLLLIGVMLVAEGMGQHVSKGYIYVAMAFSLLIEVLNMRFRKKTKPVTLRESFDPDELI